MINDALGILQNAAEHGPQIDLMLELVHWFMLILFVVWTTFFLYAIIRFRKSRSPKADYVGVTGPASTYGEVAVVIIEAVLLLGLAFPLWAKRVNEFPTGKDVIHVRVIAEQFNWNIWYPGPDGAFCKQDVNLVSSSNPLGRDKNDPDGKDDAITLNQMHLPVNRSVIVHLTSKDVIHSFALRHMRITQDTIPGMNIPCWFKPIKTSAELRENMAQTCPTKVSAIPPEKVVMGDYKGKDGTVLVSNLTSVTEEVISRLAAAGITEVRVAPEYPMEIACAQLCGNGHYKMRGFLTVESAEDYDKWLKEQQANTAAGGGSGYE